MIQYLSTVKMSGSGCKKENRNKRILLSISLKPTANDLDHCGQNKLEGTVEVESKADILVHGILLSVHGIVRTEILTIRKDGKHKYSSNIHVESSYVFGNGSEETMLTQGRHSFPFSFCLAPHLPSTFYGVYGIMKYLITAQTHSNNEGNEEVFSTSQPVLIKRYLDLANGFAYGKAISVPSRIECPQKGLKTKYCSSLKYILKIYKTGYAAGETIPFVIDLSNPEKRKIASITIAIIKKTVYGDRKYSTEVIDELTKVSTTEVSNKKTSITWMGNLFVPDSAVPTHAITVAISKMKKKPILSHQYSVYVKLVQSVGNCIEGELPIIIGTSKYDSRAYRDLPHCSMSLSRFEMMETSGEISRDLRRQHSLLPSYSQAIYQPERRASLETLPPPYEEAIAMSSLALSKETNSTLNTTK